VRGVDELAEVFERAVLGQNRVVVGDVVAAVPQGRGVHRQQPEAVHAEPFEVVELLGQAAEVAHAVAIRVVEAAHINLVKDRVLEPEWVVAEFARLGHHSPFLVASCVWLCVKDSGNAGRGASFRAPRIHV
jgi:hypothetical protein